MAHDDDFEVVWSGKDPLLPPRPSRSIGTWHEQKVEVLKRPYTKRTPKPPLTSNITDEKDT